jgi:hypothetical protein
MTAIYTETDLDQAYQDGIEDLAHKIVELIYQSDFSISLKEIVSFIEAELGYDPDRPIPRYKRER